MKFWFKGQSIQKKIIISSLIVTIIPLIMLEMVFLYMNQQRNVTAILESASVYADNLEERYRAEMNKLERLATTLRDFTPLDTYLSSEYSMPLFTLFENPAFASLSITITFSVSLLTV